MSFLHRGLSERHNSYCCFYSYYTNTIIIHKLPYDLKCVHSLLGKPEALAIMGQSLEMDSMKCFSLIGNKCLYRENLLIVLTTLAAPKTAPIKRQFSKIRYIF